MLSMLIDALFHCIACAEDGQTERAAVPIKWSKDGQTANRDDRRQGENAFREENTVGGKINIRYRNSFW